MPIAADASQYPINQWVDLFNGRDFTNFWQPSTPLQQVAFSIEKGNIVLSGGGPGYLFGDTVFDWSYALQVEIKLSYGGNAGIIVGCSQGDEHLSAGAECCMNADSGSAYPSFTMLNVANYQVLLNPLDEVLNHDAWENIELRVPLTNYDPSDDPSPELNVMVVLHNGRLVGTCAYDVAPGLTFAFQNFGVHGSGVRPYIQIRRVRIRRFQWLEGF